MGMNNSRRTFLVTVAGACGYVAFRRLASPHAALAAGKPSGTVTIVQFGLDGKPAGKIVVPRINKSDDEWKKQLTPLAFDITRRAGTERPYTAENLNVHDKGLFRCICCDTALFSSNTKFESGTGWPSFWEPIARENVLEIRDSTFGMDRTAVACRQCDAHLGHVFNDGPQPTGLRYCMNGAAMHFVKLA